MRAQLAALLLCALWTCGCAGDAQVSSLVVARPYASSVPAQYSGQPTPLVLVLHGYGATGFVQDAYFGVSALSEAHGFLYAYPDGTVDSMGKQFWNATDDCCDYDRSGVDDVAYLTAVIDDMRRRYAVDDGRIFVIGHSNGGYMAHRLACDAASKIAAIVSLAGVVWKDPALCQPSEPVALLQVDGDQDTDVPYAGTSTAPSAEATVATWAEKDACTGALTPTDARLDLDDAVPGPETSIARYTCARGAAELWTMHGSVHIPTLRLQAWGDGVWSFFSQHGK